MSTHLHSLALGAALLIAAGAACNSNPELLQLDAPDFRGITIPLPPPSLVDEPAQEVELEGTIGREPPPGTVIGLWESELAQGYLVPPDANGDFTFTKIDVTFDQSCLELWYEYDEAGDLVESTHAFYALVILSGDMCDADPMVPCSDKDLEDNCVCLDRRNSGC